MRSHVVTMTLAVVVSGAFAATPAAATLPVAAAARAAVDPAAVDPPAVEPAVLDTAAADLAFVSWLRFYDPHEVVRSAARTAVSSSEQARAVAQFLATGYASAQARGAATWARNSDFAQRVLDTHRKDVSPAVYAAAAAAVKGTRADQAWFAQTGYAAAKEFDRQGRAADGRRAAAIVQADRDFVTVLRDTDPGEQVRAGAAWALRPEATDGDLVEFFAYGWANGAALDLDVFRTQLADRDVTWRVTLHRLFSEAEAAERAAIQAGGAAQARAAAARAWQQVNAQAGPARTVWADAEAVALIQAANWEVVAAAAARATATPNFKVIAGPATTNQRTWDAQREAATEQARHWTEMLTRARAGEARMTTAG